MQKKGYKIVGGTDEAGRGALAGPVSAAIVIIKDASLKIFKGVQESKKLTEKQRENFYRKIIKSPYLQWGTGRVFPRKIDKINILEATKLAMIRAVKNVERKMKKRLDLLILDGNFKINLNISQKSIQGADEKVLSCACASIIAKVSRDRFMRVQDKLYSKYFFSRHKGYGTALHFKAIHRYGPCELHRKSFSPIKGLKNKLSTHLPR
ncbi:MAG: ribonuclease HII [Candidatus Bathyarchaeota archaeon]|nr:ribonuclease HII [Candidatus Bathyarchaeota archaeon]